MVAVEALYIEVQLGNVSGSLLYASEISNYQRNADPLNRYTGQGFYYDLSADPGGITHADSQYRFHFVDAPHLIDVV